MKLQRGNASRCVLAAAVIQALAFAATPVMAQTAPGTPQADTGKDAARANAARKVDETKTLQAIVVTAQRRSQNEQEVPIAVTAVTGHQLEARHIDDVADLASVAPNLTVARSPADSTTASVSIRGFVSGLDSALWKDSPIGIYVDGVYIGKASGNIQNLLNLERVEVLRGPQGTLFGRNAMAGVVNFVTQAPSGVFTGQASIGLGNYNGKIAKVMLDLPAMGKFKASIAGRIERRDGWVKTTPGSAVSELDNRHNEGALFTLEFDATDDLTFTYRHDHSDVNVFPPFNQVINSDIEKQFHIPGIIVSEGRQDTASIDVPVFERSRIDGDSLIAAWKVNDFSTLKYIGAHREVHWDDNMDLDGSPIPFAAAGRVSRYRQTSHELQYLGSNGPWSWVSGLYYFDDAGYSSGPQQYFFGKVNYNPNEFNTATKSRALYGQVDYKLSDRLTLTAGIRRTIDDKSMDRYQVLNGAVTMIPKGTSAHATFSATTPTVSLMYQVNPASMLYARYAKGYMSGGFNGSAQTVAGATTPFQPENQQSVEFGSKNILWGNRLRLNADVFYSRTNGLQQGVFTAQGSAGSMVLNVGRSHGYGFELQSELQATDDFSIGLNYGFLRRKFDTFMQLGQNIADNRPPQFAPRNTVSLVLNDTLARTSKGVLRGTLDYRYTSQYYEYVFPLRQTTPPQQLAGNSIIKANGVLNGRLEFGSMNWGDRLTGSVALWVQNLTNREHIDSIIDFGPGFGNLRTANYNPPRTFGVTVSATW